MPNTGEKPGMGVYSCSQCGKTVVIDDNADPLPSCPNCNNTEYK